MVSSNTEANGDVLVLTQEEVLAMIDREARRRLDISGSEFLKRLKQGTLKETVAKRDIEMLVKLLG